MERQFLERQNKNWGARTLLTGVREVSINFESSPREMGLFRAPGTSVLKPIFV